MIKGSYEFRIRIHHDAQPHSEEEKPSHILVAFDAGKTTFRHASFKEYKGGRQKTPPELSGAISFHSGAARLFSNKRYELENYEADDIIGTLSLQAEKDGFEVKVISGDKDLTQLSSPSTTVSITKKGITEIEEYTPKHIHEKYGLSPLQIIDLKGLMGGMPPIYQAYQVLVKRPLLSYCINLKPLKIF